MLMSETLLLLLLLLLLLFDNFPKGSKSSLLFLSCVSPQRKTKMGAALSKLTDGSKPPIPIKPAPFSYFGLFLNCGMILPSVFYIDSLQLPSNIKEEAGSSKLLDAVSGYYYKKTNKPSKLASVFALLGLLYYGRHFIGVFTSNAETKRKISDFIGFFLFIYNLHFTATKVLPLERQVGEQFSLDKKDSNKWSEQKTKFQQARLKKVHLTALLITLALAVQQTISFKTQ